MARVGGERHAGQQAEGGARLLVVVLHGIGQPPLGPGVQIAEDQPRVLVVPRPEDQPPSVRRQGGPHRRPVAGRARVPLAGLHLVGLKLVLRKLGVVLPVAGAPRVPDVPPVRRHRGTDGLQVVRLRDQHRAAAPVHVEQLQLGEPAAPEGAHGRHHVVAVRHPLGRLRPVRSAPRDPHGVRAVAGDDPDVLPPVGVGRVDDARSVGREPGLGVERHPRRELGRVAAGDGQREQVPEVVEDDGLPVGAHVQRDPAPFRHVEGHPPVHRQGQARVLGLAIGLVLVPRRLDRRRAGLGRRRGQPTFGHSRDARRYPHDQQHEDGGDETGIRAARPGAKGKGERRDAAEQGRHAHRGDLLWLRPHGTSPCPQRRSPPPPVKPIKACRAACDRNPGCGNSRDRKSADGRCTPSSRPRSTPCSAGSWERRPGVGHAWT